MKIKRFPFLFPAILILLSLITIITVITYPTRQFHNLTRCLWINELSADTLSTHYLVAFPENFKLDSHNVTFPNYSSTNITPDYLSMFSDISTRFLTKSDTNLYNRLLASLSLSEKSTSFSYYDEPFSPFSGVQSELPILLAEYSFYRKEDIDNYLKLLALSDTYLNSLCQYEIDKSNAGLFMNATAAKSVENQCIAIMDKNTLDNHSHFLHTTFEERLETLLSEKVITKQEQEAYIEDNDRLLTTVLAPAYEKIADTFFILEDTGSNDAGLFYYPDGRSYYEYLLQKNTGSSKSVAQIKALLLENLSSDLSSLSALPKEYENPELLYEDFPISTPEEMLADLTTRIEPDFPSLSKVSYVVKTVDPSLEQYVSPAYYLTVPLDAWDNNVIYINSSDTSTGIFLYTTLAHEGYPGHLYQTVYERSSLGSNDLPIMSLFYFGGYVEGYATYVEMQSYNYVKDLLSENGATESTLSLVDLIRLDRSIRLELYCLLDINIHYEGASYEQVHSTLSQFGITDETTTKTLYNYIVEEPTTYLKYYLGYAEILECKQLAKDSWGTAYSDKQFHTFLLEEGPADFDTIKTAIKIKNDPQASRCGSPIYNS